jgi:hypothetical protein
MHNLFFTLGVLCHARGPGRGSWILHLSWVNLRLCQTCTLRQKYPSQFIANQGVPLARTSLLDDESRLQAVQMGGGVLDNAVIALPVISLTLGSDGGICLNPEGTWKLRQRDHLWVRGRHAVDTGGKLSLQIIQQFRFNLIRMMPMQLLKCSAGF